MFSGRKISHLLPKDSAGRGDRPCVPRPAKPEESMAGGGNATLDLDFPLAASTTFRARVLLAQPFVQKAPPLLRRVVPSIVEQVPLVGVLVGEFSKQMQDAAPED